MVRTWKEESEARGNLEVCFSISVPQEKKKNYQEQSVPSIK